MSRVSRSLLLISVAFGIGFAATSASASSYNIIHNFAGATSDGDKPQTKLVADSEGRLYGATQQGGAHFGGSIFRLTKNGKNWSEETLFSFSAGTGPNGTLLIGPSGELYGTAPANGTFGQGTAWRLDPNGTNWTLTTLHEFHPPGSQDGFFPTAGLIFGKDGLLYGTTKGTPPQDGQSATQDPMYGTVFSLSPQGDTVEYSVLHVFGGTNDGQFPGFGSLIADRKGVLTGTTSAGGKNTEGMVFQITPPKRKQTVWGESSIYDFKSTGLDAIGPAVGVVASKNGVLFGCANGGQNGNGVVYTLTPAVGAQWSEQLLYSFGAQANDPKSNAVCDVSVSNQGLVFGTSSGGGVNNTGAVFRVDPPASGQTAWTETVLHSFGTQGSGDGTFPGTAPVQVKMSVFGVTPSGGTNNRGAVYALKP